ncbi:hypothetical protein V3C99_004239, partial [Haemonchus contortus]
DTGAVYKPATLGLGALLLSFNFFIWFVPFALAGLIPSPFWCSPSRCSIC